MYECISANTLLRSFDITGPRLHLAQAQTLSRHLASKMFANSASTVFSILDRLESSTLGAMRFFRDKRGAH